VLPTLNGSTYYVTVSTSPATDGATIRCQISGTDGYRFSQDAVTVGGVATFVAAAASPGSGIHDAINAFDLNGRASGSASLTF
jgi:hypothetical protein